MRSAFRVATPGLMPSSARTNYATGTPTRGHTPTDWTESGRQQQAPRAVERRDSAVDLCVVDGPMTLPGEIDSVGAGSGRRAAGRRTFANVFARLAPAAP